jgi:phenylalanyl-tRNA synthetase alpha chain
MNDLRDKYLAAIGTAADEAGLEEVRLAALGKKGEIALRMRELGQMSPEERMTVAPALNAIRDEVASAIAAKKQALQDAALDERLRAEWLDVTLPVRQRRVGTIHPISQVTQEHDTFYMARAEGDNRPPHVLRTHTSPVQIRSMLSKGAPLRIIAPGRVFRADYDQTHSPMFHQVEGLAIDRDITMANLKWTLEEFLKAFFEVPSVDLRFRASHFPFTEPSAEVDVRCSWQGGTLKLGEGDSWLEILGSGMVHPNVLTSGGIDPAQWQGFAFGMGIDRLAMLKYGIPDLRAFFESDLRWLRHYGFGALEVPTLAGGL